MARIEGISENQAGPITRMVYWFTKRMLGKVPEPLTIAARHSQVFQAVAGFEWAIGKADRVPLRLKALAGIKAASLIGCPF